MEDTEKLIELLKNYDVGKRKHLISQPYMETQISIYKKSHVIVQKSVNVSSRRLFAIPLCPNFQSWWTITGV